jgi:hypothetical protein
MHPLTPGAYALQEFSAQILSSRIGEGTEFDFLQLEGEIDEDIIENIENAKNYLNIEYEEIQEIIKEMCMIFQIPGNLSNDKRTSAIFILHIIVI